MTGTSAPRVGIDAAVVPPAAALKAAGLTFAAGYVSRFVWKCWTWSRIRELRAAGIDVVFVFEDSATRALDGYQAGRDDAAFAAEKVSGYGAPAAQPIYFAVDVDTTEPRIANYVRGLVSVLGRQRVGIYGGRNVVSPLLTQGDIGYAWQTYAWSGGKRDSRAHLHQYSNGHTVAGHSVDFDHAYAADFGQWSATPAETRKPPVSKPPMRTPPASKPPAPKPVTEEETMPFTEAQIRQFIREEVVNAITGMNVDVTDYADVAAGEKRPHRSLPDVWRDTDNYASGAAGNINRAASVIRADIAALQAEVAALKAKP